MYRDPQPLRDFYTVEEFADKLALHPNTIRKAIKSGRIAGFRVGSGKKAAFRIPATEINRIASEELNNVLEDEVERRIKERTEKSDE